MFDDRPHLSVRFKEMPPQSPMDLGDVSRRIDGLISLLAFARAAVLYESEETHEYHANFGEDPLLEALSFGWKLSHDHGVVRINFNSPFEIVVALMSGGVAAVALAQKTLELINRARVESEKARFDRDYYRLLRSELAVSGIPEGLLRDVLNRGNPAMPNPYQAAATTGDISSAEVVDPPSAPDEQDSTGQ